MLGMSMSQLATLKEMLLKERARQGLGEEFARDEEQSKKKFRAAKG